MSVSSAKVHSVTALRASTDGPAQPTLARILQERLLSGSEVLAGEARLHRPLSWCHALADVREPHLDLSRVAVIVDVAELDAQRWSDLMRSDCVAVLFRADPGTHLPFALRDGGPVVVRLPVSVSRRAVIELVATLHLAQQTHVLQYGQRVHSTLAGLLHRGAGLTALCSRLARLSGCSVAVLGTDLHLLAFDPGTGHLDPHAVTLALKGSQERMEAALTRAEAPRGAGLLDLEVREQPVTCLVATIELLEQRDGWVVLLNDDPEITDHDLAEHRVAVEQAVTIMGTELLRIRGLERAEERARGNFVHALLHARFPTHADLVARASHYDFDVAGRYGVVVAHSGGLIAHSDSPAKLADMAREAAGLGEGGGLQTLTAVVGDVIAVVRQVPPNKRGQADPAVDELRQYAGVMSGRLTDRTQREVMVAFGRPVTGADAIAESYREARIALDLRQRLHVPDVCGFADLRVDSVLLELAQREEGREFADEFLDPLRAERDGSLVDVARVYVESGGNLNAAARRLTVHRNTMLYKLSRITRLLQRDVRDPDTQFAVWLALRLTDLAETAKRVNRDLMSG
jgi:sugar diacid utilization regulator